MLQNFSIEAPTYVSLIWALILLISSRANRARFTLGIFMFAVFMIFLSHVIYFNHLKEIYLYFDLIFVFFSLSIYPIYYWYIKLLTVQTKIEFKDLLMLTPALTILIATTVIYLLMTKEVRNLYVYNYLYGYGTMESAPLLIKIQLILCYVLQTVYFLQIVFIFVKSQTYIKKYNENIANFYSNLENLTLEWPQLILYSFVAASIITISSNFVGRSYYDKYPFGLFLTCVGYSIMLFILGYLGYLQNRTVDNYQVDANVFPSNNEENINHKKIKVQLLKLFDKGHVYRNSDLKITDVASQLHTNRTYISTIINNDYACSFSAFVNKYRVEEAKTELLKSENSNLCLDHISTLVGFGSLHSFIRVFKEIEGTTPGRYREIATMPLTNKTTS